MIGQYVYRHSDLLKKFNRYKGDREVALCHAAI